MFRPGTIKKKQGIGAGLAKVPTVDCLTSLPKGQRHRVNFESANGHACWHFRFALFPLFRSTWFSHRFKLPALYQPPKHRKPWSHSRRWSRRWRPAWPCLMVIAWCHAMRRPGNPRPRRRCRHCGAPCGPNRSWWSLWRNRNNKRPRGYHDWSTNPPLAYHLQKSWLNKAFVRETKG